METIEAVLRDVPLFEGLTPAQLEVIAGCGSNVQFREGELLFKDRDPAESFYVLRHGSVALETFVPARGAVVIETLEAGEVVGWSWLFPPYQWHFDARAVSLVRATSFDGVCLRGKCDERPEAGVRPDLALRPGHDPPPPVDAAAAPRRVRRWPPQLRPRRCGRADGPAARSVSRNGGGSSPTRGRSSSSRSAASACCLRPASSRCCTPSGSARCRSRSRATSTGRSCTRCARSGAVSRAICASEPGAVLGVRGPFGNAWPVEAAVGSDVVVVAGGIGLAPLRPAAVRRPRPARRVRRRGPPVRQPDTRRPPLPDGARPPPGPVRPPGRRHGRRRRGRLARQGRRRAEADRRGPLRPRLARSRSSAGPRS